MAYARKTNQNELVQLRDEITNEVNTDAEHLATSVFGNQGDHPDMERMQNDQIDALYRAAYQRDDRPFLQSEARRDPQQFLKVVERLGVSLSPPTPPPAPVLPSPPPVALPAPVVQAPPVIAPPPMAPSMPPVAAPAPVQPGLPNASVPAASPPVLLGPNGQPLLPSGAGV